MTVWTKGPAGGAFVPVRYNTTQTIPPVPTNFIGGGTEMTAPNQAVAITTQIANAAAGSTVTLAPGIYMLDFRASGQLMVCILLKSNVNFDFSQAELRLRPGQATVLDRDGSGTPIAGTTSTQWADIITNQNVSGSSQNLSNCTVTVGCLNGRCAGNAGTYLAGGGTDPDLDNGAMYDGISLKNASNCVIQGGFGPWSRGPIQADGKPLYLGVIKNMRGWDGGGGDTEAFHYTFDSSLGTSTTPNIAKRLEVVVDDGSIRSASGGSSNSGAWVLHEDIVSHGTKAQGMTSWRTNNVTYRRVNSYGHNATGMRNEEGTGNVATDCWTHDNGGNGYNIKGSITCSDVWATTAVTATNILITGNNASSPNGNAIQYNSVVTSAGVPAINFQGRWGLNRLNGTSHPDNLCSGRASSSITTNMTTVTTWTNPLPN